MKYNEKTKTYKEKNEYGSYYIHCFVSFENAKNLIDKYKSKNDYVSFLLDEMELHICVFDTIEAYDHIHICQMRQFQEFNDLYVLNFFEQKDTTNQ